MYDGGHRKSDLVTDGLRRRVELEWWPAGSPKVERERVGPILARWHPFPIGGCNPPGKVITDQPKCVSSSTISPLHVEF